MHNGLDICHLDIKPENVVLDEADPDAFVLRLTDFDLSFDARGRQTCHQRCGTLPFAAPEVLLREGGFDPRAADVWSLGLLFLELHAGVHVVERALGLRSASELQPVPMAERVVGFLGAPDAVDSMLADGCRVEARPHLPVLVGMLSVEPSARPPAELVAEAGEQHASSSAAPSPPATEPPHGHRRRFTRSA